MLDAGGAGAERRGGAKLAAETGKTARDLASNVGHPDRTRPTHVTANSDPRDPWRSGAGGDAGPGSDPAPRGGARDPEAWGNAVAAQRGARSTVGVGTVTHSHDRVDLGPCR